MQKAVLTGLAVLVVEDDLLLRKQLAGHLERLGADVTTAGQRDAAKRLLADLNFDFVLLDIHLPDGNGLDLLREKRVSATSGVIVMTADGAVSGAVEAMKLGALDYLVKPFDPAELSLVMARSQRARQAARLEEHRQNNESQETFFFGNALAPIKSQLDKILAADGRLVTNLPPVLIHGETGTGKTTIARWLHRRGPRAQRPLVELNCSALPEQLAESELFGHERGAFTDARSARMGLLEAAHEGTLFLDELPSLSLPLQAKLLTVIEDQKIRRIGGNKEIPVDVRIIAATNRNLRALLAEGEFREDLYHRLDLFRISIPPLRDRGEDILRLAGIFLDRLFQRHRLPSKRITPLGQKRLLSYPWPGNVRELAHELERAIVFEESAELNFDLLTFTAEPLQGKKGNDWFDPSYRFPPEGFSLEEAIHRLIQHALQQTNNNVSGAARILGVTRDYIRYRLGGARTPKTGDESPPSVMTQP